MTAKLDLSTLEVPVIDLDYIDSCYQRLTQMDVRLDPNPLEFGPRRLNGKVAQTRAMLSNCERMYLQLSHDLGRFKRAHRSLETILKLKIAELLSNDPETRAGKNYADREALAKTKLQELVLKVDGLVDGTAELEAALTVVKTKRGDLRDIQGRLKDQIRLCHDEIGLGSRWGSKVPDAPDIQPNEYARQKASKLDAFSSGSRDAETHLPPIDPDESEEDLDAALGEMLTDGPSPVEEATDSSPVVPQEPSEQEEDQTDPEPVSVELETILPSVAALSDVESFLDADLDTSNVPARAPEIDEDPDLDDLLSSFG